MKKLLYSFIITSFSLPMSLLFFPLTSSFTYASSQDCSTGTVSCSETIGIGADIDSCSQACNSSGYKCSYDAAKNCTYESGATICNGVCKIPPPATYQKGSCEASTSICYTGTKGADFAPGYQCGDAKGYKYGTGGGQADNGIPSCRSQSATPNGFCCDSGTALPPLPPHQGYDLGTNFSGYGCTQSTSICYTGGYKDPILPGETCAKATGWHYGTDGNGHVAQCSQLPGVQAVCCDPGSGNGAPPPNPCPNAPTPGVCMSVDTALGTIDVSGPGGFIGAVFGLLLSIAGGTAIILIIFSGYQIMTAQGDPEKVKAAQERLTSAIIGLLFMIFSVTILQILGVDILHIPGFGK